MVGESEISNVDGRKFAGNFYHERMASQNGGIAAAVLM